jgi:tripartite-type tricarboxylate transporter receptor subunit TctC
MPCVPKRDARVKPAHDEACDCFALTVLSLLIAGAQTWPDRTVTIVAPAAPGGLYSLFARLIATRLEQRFGKTFVVENKPGASSVVGATYVARAAPDGTTLMVATSSTMATNVTLFKSLPYDPADLAPVALIARVPEVLVVNGGLPIHSVADIAALARATPGGLHFGSAGPGTAQHLGGEMLKTALGVALTHVPYKGMQPALADVAGGHIAMSFAPIPLALPLIEAGKLRPIGLSMAQRVEALPDVPPLAEVGVKDFDAASWFMLVAPARTPKEIVATLYDELRRLGADPAMRAEFVRLGLVPVESPPPDELKKFVGDETLRWARVVRQAGLAGSE